MPTAEPVDTRMTSIVPGAGALLRTLVSYSCWTQPDLRILELGSGSGVGLAWMVPVLSSSASVLTFEREKDRAAAVQQLYADDPRVTVRAGDWHEELHENGFDIAFPTLGSGKSSATWNCGKASSS
ncbi:MAG: hypothetical protein ACRDN0_02250 [Trebonia sp.]